MRYAKGKTKKLQKKLSRLHVAIAAGVLVLVLGAAFMDSHALQQNTKAHGDNSELTAVKQRDSKDLSVAAGAKAATKGSAHTTADKLTTNADLPQLAPLQTKSCTIFPPMHQFLSQSLSAELRKMAQYEQLCKGALFDRSSFFTGTPTTAAEAVSDASDVADSLKEYAKYGIKPLVFIEPSDDSGNIDLATYATGAYDGALDTYFSSLKADGVTDAMMGMWVIMPEGNLPEWTSVDPAIYANVVTRTAQLQKKYFPASQSSVMLDSETYPSASSYDNGTYVSLVPYVQGIPKGLIDSFGLQGFPWTGNAKQPGEESYDPTVYLNTNFAMQAAQTLGVSNIWVNTGTFNQMYANQAGLTVTNTPVQRQTMLNGVLSEVEGMKAKGYTVAIHLFAENKASTAEGTDWSYWQDQPGNDQNTAVFTTFVHDAATNGVPLWLFDSTDH